MIISLVSYIPESVNDVSSYDRFRAIKPGKEVRVGKKRVDKGDGEPQTYGEVRR